MKTIQERLRDGAETCHARNIQLDYARIATKAADRIDALEAEVEMWKATSNAVVDFEKVELRKQIEALTKDARLGAYVAQVAINHGWSLGEPEDAYSFMVRKCREVAIDDCGKDAERYRFIRVGDPDNAVMSWVNGLDDWTPWASPEDVDQSIDEAIAAIKEQV